MQSQVTPHGSDMGVMLPSLAALFVPPNLFYFVAQECQALPGSSRMMEIRYSKRSGEDPKDIYIMTYTRAAAVESARRNLQCDGPPRPSQAPYRVQVLHLSPRGQLKLPSQVITLARPSARLAVSSLRADTGTGPSTRPQRSRRYA